MRASQLELRPGHRACSPSQPQSLDAPGPSTSSRSGAASLRCSAAVGKSASWRLATGTTLPKNYSSLAGPELKPPTQPPPDPEVMKHVEAALGPLDTKPLDKLIVRVRTAREENDHIAKFDYVVVNRDGELDDCVRQVAAIVEAEKARVGRRLWANAPQQPAAAPHGAGAPAV
ncbi:hypothetical protein TSOC_004135 [Tetrabaena socialis]|uniref:Guanylate kinase n=1 Tax=Tetrabaena socialis TaxID=47790 RepID=A0A2J8A9S9_9CHLO|nr:hypothetical protein TSOC_004135 [Tetrabaena socialis]|eukprot:PNH09270.1 hypothetical protein TSOC_004135 [Tetrabaena socialis]